MHDPQFGLGIDTRVHLWHLCLVRATEVEHNGATWVNLEFVRQVTLPAGGWNTERVEVQVPRGVALRLMTALLELFPVEVGRMTCKLSEVTIQEAPERPPPDDPPSE